MLKHLPNALTLLRLVLAPVIAWLLWAAADSPNRPHTGGDYILMSEIYQEIASLLFLASALFIFAALTDLFDGMIARALNAHSKFGRLIDPIADKALVGLPLLVIAFGAWRSAYPLWPVIVIATAVIVIRDVAMTVIRLTAPDGEGAPVSSLAKIKTAVELAAVGAFPVICAIVMQLQANGVDILSSNLIALEWTWLAALVLAAALSAWTGWQYLRPRRG